MSEEKQVQLVGYRYLKRKISSDASESMRTALAKYGDTISFSYKYCPNIEKKPSAFDAAKAVIAAEKKGKPFRSGSIPRCLY